MEREHQVIILVHLQCCVSWVFGLGIVLSVVASCGRNKDQFQGSMFIFTLNASYPKSCFKVRTEE